jgi:hypothetical protein
MKNIKCVIRKNLKTKNRLHYIYLRYTYNRRYVLFNTQVDVAYKNWNRDAGRVRKSFNSDVINKVLEKKEFELERIILQLILQNLEATLINVKAEYYKVKNLFQDEKTKPIKQDETKFLKDFKKFIADKERVVKAETTKTYYTTYNKLEKFQKDTNYTLHFETINNEFYIQFLSYLREKFKLLDNSADKHIKNIKLFMYWALSKELHNNAVFQTFKRTRTSTDFVVLEEKELRKLYYEYKPSNKEYDEIKDAFIFGCTTGLRYSDLKRLEPGNFHITRDPLTNEIDENAARSVIKTSIQKTEDYIDIPINHFISEMIEKYSILESKQIPFTKYSIHTFNKLIKIVIKEAGIDSMVKVSKKRAGEFVSVSKPKYEFVSSHTMRRTFISLLSTITETTNIQAVSGHKDIKVLTGYIKRSDKELNAVGGSFNSLIFNGSKLNKLDDVKPDRVKVKSVSTRFIPGS